MTYGDLYAALGAALKKRPEAKDEPALIAGKRPNGLSYYDTDCEAVEVRIDELGLIILTEGNQ